MGASHTIKLAEKNGQDLDYGPETLTALPEEFILVTDPDDRLYCPGVLDEPTDGLLTSMRLGWDTSKPLTVVNRGKKGGALVLVVSDGRSRVKAARAVNKEREGGELAPLRPNFTIVSEDEAYQMMIASHNKQERKPSFDARCWGQYKRQFAKVLGKMSLDDSDLRECRKSYSELRKCSVNQVKTWETILSAHPEVLRLFDEKHSGMSKNAVIDIVESTAYDAQPEAARKVVELAKRKNESAAAPVQESRVTHFVGDDCTPTHAEPTVPAPEPAKRGKRSDAAERRAALGMASNRSRPVAELRALANALRKTGREEFDGAIAALLWAANGTGSEEDAAFMDLAEAAKGTGWKG